MGERTEKTRAEDTARITEEVRREAANLAPDGDIDVTNPEAQAGRRLPRALVMRRIAELNRHLVYEQSVNYPECGGIYFNGYRHDDLTGQLEYGHWFICGIPHEAVAEFDLREAVSEVIPDARLAMVWQQIQRADNRIPGWRSILHILVKNELINLEAAYRKFHIAVGRSSEYWQRATN